MSLKSPLALFVLGMLLLPMTGCLTSKLWEGDCRYTSCVYGPDDTRKATFYISIPQKGDLARPYQDNLEEDEKIKDPCIHYDFFCKITYEKNAGFIPQQDGSKHEEYLEGHLDLEIDDKWGRKRAADIEKMRVGMTNGVPYSVCYNNLIQIRQAKEDGTGMDRIDIHVDPLHPTRDTKIDGSLWGDATLITAEEFQRKNTLKPLASDLPTEHHYHIDHFAPAATGAKVIATPVTVTLDVIGSVLLLPLRLIEKTTTFLYG